MTVNRADALICVWDARANSERLPVWFFGFAVGVGRSRYPKGSGSLVSTSDLSLAVEALATLPPF
jgi:hypothetical protein